MAFSTINTAITGLRAHNSWLQVIGNNIANLNTPGFKRSRPHFSSLMETNSGAGCGAGPIGQGVRVDSVDRIFTQGPVTQTSRSLDVALQGEGFFAVENGGRELYTRDGAFDIDRDGVLRHIGTNAAVLGANNQPLTAPMNLIDQPEATTQVAIQGNFDAAADGPTAEVLTTRAPLETVSNDPVTANTELNTLSANFNDYTTGDTLTITGTDPDGNHRSSVFVYGDEMDTSGSPLQNGTTLGDLMGFINGTGIGPNSTVDKFPGANLSLSPDGNLSFASETAGDTNLALTVEDGLTKADGSPQAGQSNFQLHNLEVATDGTDPFNFNSSIEIFDANGQARQLNLTFTRQDSDPANPLWNMSADIAGAVFSDNTVTGIRFNEDGSFGGVAGTGNGDSNISFQIPNGPSATINLDFGAPGSFDGATQFGGFNSASAKGQNGKPLGQYAGVDFDDQGSLIVNFTNGKTENRGQLKVVTFPDQEKLEGLGGNLYSKSDASGQPMQGTLQSGATSILPHYLEGSNVDQAQELTNMILAQNGFSANARAVSTAQQMFDIVSSLVR